MNKFTKAVPLNRRLCSFSKKTNGTHLLQILLTFNSTPCGNIHEITKNKDSTKRLITLCTQERHKPTSQLGG